MAVDALQACVLLAKYIHDKREELRSTEDGARKLLEKIDRLVPALTQLSAQPAKIQPKAAVIAALQSLLADCKTWVDKYTSRGAAGRIFGAIVGKDVRTIDALNTELQGLMIEFLTISAADMTIRESGGKFNATFRRAKWAEIQFHKTKPRSGASSDVYRASWDHKDCAVKIIKPNAVGDIRAVIRELDIISELSHKNIVQTYAICEDLKPSFGPVAIVMEYCACGDMQQLLESDKERAPHQQLSHHQLLSLLLDICSAMRYCAQRSVVHRDLKTKNVVVTEHLQAKVCDFGLSKFVESGKSQLTISGSQGLGCTPEYAAPELLLGSRDGRYLKCDVFSFGVVLHEVITRQRPWAGRLPVQVIAAVTRGDSLPIPAGLDPDVHHALVGALEHSEQRRFSFEEVRGLLNRAYEQKSSFFSPPGAPPSSSSPSRAAPPPPPHCPPPHRPSAPPPPPSSSSTPSLEDAAREALAREQRELERERREAEEAQARLEAAKQAKRMSLERRDIVKQKEQLRRVKIEAEQEERTIRREREANAEAEAKAAPSQLWSSSEKGDIGAVRGLCEKWGGRREVVNWANPDEVELGWRCKDTTSLFVASINGHTDVVKVLASLPGIDINKADSNGSTPLRAASGNGHTDVVKVLVSLPGIDINKAAKDGRTPLWAASYSGHTDVVKVLTSLPGIDINKASNGGCTPLYAASFKGRTDVVKVLASLPGIDINKAAKDGSTPLRAASYSGHTDVVKVLVSLPGIDINKASNNGCTPLGSADNEEIKAILRAKGAKDPVAQAKAKAEAEAQAGSLARLREEAKAWLPSADEVQRRASLAEKNRGKKPCLDPGLGILKTHTGKAIWQAAEKGDVKAMRAFSEEWMGNDIINWANPDKDGWTPLRVASVNGRTDVVKVLASLPGIDINKPNNDGYTPLCAASYRCHTDVVKVLVSLPGIDINKAGNDGRTPLRAASNEEIKAILRAKGAK